MNKIDDYAMATEIIEEVHRARKKFPSAEGSMCALTEEVGELAKATLDESPQRIRREAIQVAAMAVRVATEGDPSLDAIRCSHGVMPFSEWHDETPA